MLPSYVFQAYATPAVPAQYTYRRQMMFRIKPVVDYSAAADETFEWQYVVDVEVLFGDCDDGATVEWKVQLKPNSKTAATGPYTFKYGYINRQSLEAQGPRRYDMALSIAQQSLSEAFPWREERVQH